MKSEIKTPRRVRPHKVSKEIKAEKARNKAVLKGINGIGSSGLDIFKLIILVLFISMLFSALMGTYTKTFLGLLETLKGAPTFSRNVALWTPPTLGDWGVFDWLRSFLVNDLGGMLQIIAFLGTALVDLLTLCLYFLRWFLF